MLPILDGTVPDKLLSDKRRICSLVRDPRLDGMVPPSNILPFRFSVSRLFKLPKEDGRVPAIELPFKTNDDNETRLPIDELMVPVRPLVLSVTDVTTDPLQLTPVHPHTGELGVLPVHAQPLKLVTEPAFKLIATAHIDASFVLAVGDTDGENVGKLDGTNDGVAEGVNEGMQVGELVGEKVGANVGLQLGRAVGRPEG
jgi:hypothetical protein